MTPAARYKREARETARAIGLCQQCLQRLAVNSYCDPCMEQRSEMQNARRLQFIRDGRCSRCGGARDNQRRKMCAKCREYSRQAQAREAV